ncbi:protein ABHD1-like [Chelonoidis abingdonii]|uniref:protein ABHD1-like n=1 Tax=Chelonoidis abingdonii TaxID=106734 RepID=UPI003F498C63
MATGGGRGGACPSQTWLPAGLAGAGPAPHKQPVPAGLAGRACPSQTWLLVSGAAGSCQAHGCRWRALGFVPELLFRAGGAAAAAAGRQRRLLGYYWVCVPQRPLLVGGLSFCTFLEAHCPIVREPFYPTPWCFEGRLQTLLRFFLQSRPRLSYRSELLRTADGGQLLLDWADNAESQRYPEPGTRPTVLLLPGLTSNSQATYVLHLVQQASRAGFRTVVFNNRGCKGRAACCAGLKTNQKEVFLHTNGQSTLWNSLQEIVSEGLRLEQGSIARIEKFLEDTDPSMAVNQAGMAMSAPDFVLMHRSLEFWSSQFITLVQKGQEAAGLVDGGQGALACLAWQSPADCGARCRYRKVIAEKVDVQHVLQAHSIREFDERYTAVVFGYGTCAAYYRDASPSHSVHAVLLPVLCLNAADDPFSPLQAIPLAAARRLPTLAVLVTAHGGHIGFLEGLFPRHESYMDRVFTQFLAAAFEHSQELSRSLGPERPAPQ